MTIKTFRGLIADGGVDTINLHSNDGKTGYRIVKFELFPYQPGQASTENTVTIHKTKPTGSAAAVTVDFSDQTLLAAGTFHESHADNLITTFFTVFDQEIFNQDIYVSHTDTIGATPVNYYIELEQMPLDLNESTVATLQSIRTNATGTVVPV
jgi:hypothetical protein